MRLWSIQAVEAWEQLQNTGVLRANPQFADPCFVPAYSWLTEQMRVRLELPPPETIYPLWAWYQWGSAIKKKPDLRFFRHTNLSCPTEVRLEIEIEDKFVLLSDYDLWHAVLNNHYLPLGEEDEAKFDAEMKAAGYLPGAAFESLNPDLQAKIRQSWQRIFDLEWENEYITYKNEAKHIQAVFRELSLQNVKKVDFFNKPAKKAAISNEFQVLAIHSGRK